MKKNILGIGLLMIVLIGYALMSDIIYRKKVQEIQIVDNPTSNYCLQLDGNTSIDKTVISGWAFEISKESEDLKKGAIILRNVEESGDDADMIQSFNWEKSNIVDDYFGDSSSHEKCRFEVEFDYDDIKGDVVYNVLLKMRSERPQTIESNYYLYDGCIFRYNPKMVKYPLVDNTDLKDIVSEGTLHYFDQEVGIWIYELEGSLYWVADEHYYFEEDGSTYIQFQLNTTQKDKLPYERIAQKYYWDNVSQNFEDYEITTELNCGKYRVCKMDIPTTYPITEIWTGYFVKGEGWRWISYFRPNYHI